MDKGDKEGNGTKIVLYLNEDSTEFCNEYRAREVIQKYCSFMPVEIYLKMQRQSRSMRGRSRRIS